jgi:hypothetical protein
MAFTSPDQEVLMAKLVWRDIPGYPHLQASSAGHIASWHSGARTELAVSQSTKCVNVWINGKGTQRSARKLYRLAFPEAPRLRGEHLDPARPAARSAARDRSGSA